MNSSQTNSVFARLEEIGLFQACARGTCCLVSRGKRPFVRGLSLSRAVVRAVHNVSSSSQLCV